MTAHEAAVEYQARGWAVFPVSGKIPATTHGVKDAATEHRLADIWFEKHPERGVALACGEPSGVWVLDLDGERGKEAFLELQQERGDLPHTVASRTGSGWHLFWKMPEGRDVRNSASQVAEKVDVRGTGGYVVLPPSPHPSGRFYEWLPGRSPDEANVEAPPSWLLDLVAPVKIETPAGQRVTVPDQIPEGGGEFGGRDEALFRIGCSLRAKGLSGDAIFAALMVENRDRCVPPLDEKTVRQKADQAARYEAGTTAPPKRNGSAPPTEAGTVEQVSIEVLDEIRREKQKPVDAIPTPWAKWNRASLGAGGAEGLARGWHVIIGAASGSGKSLAAANLAARAIRGGHDTCLISLEMSRLENVTRLLAILTGEPIRSLEHGAFDAAAWGRASERLMEQPGAFFTNPGKLNTLPGIEAAIRQQAEEGVRLVIVDYLQLAWVSGAETLYQQITEVSHVIQGLAKELEITTVGLSQVNRQTSAGTMRKEGLMGGSSLENDAEQVVLLGTPEKAYEGYTLEVQLAKNRHGPQRTWSIGMDPNTLRMHEVAE